MVERLFQLILTLQDYIDIGIFSGSIMEDQYFGPDFAIDVINTFSRLTMNIE